MRECLVDILVPLSGKGGVENVINIVAKHLNNSGFHVRIVQMVYDNVPWVSPEIEFYPILKNRKVSDIEEFTDLYLEFLKKFGMPEIVIAVPWPFLSYIAKKALLYLGNNMTKIVSWLHGPVETYKKYGTGGVEHLQFADSIFVLTKNNRDIIKKYLPDARVEIVRNPVDMGNAISGEKYHPEAKTLLFVGRLSEEKCVDTIIESIAKTKDNWKLIIIGDGEEKDRLMGITAGLGVLQRVVFKGWLDNPWTLEENITATVLSSSYEGFPLVAIESMACGIPVISTPVDGIRELINPGENGYLFNYKDSDGLAQILDMISEGTLNTLSSEGCIESVSEFKKDKALKDFTDKLTGVLDKISVIIPCYNVEDKISRCLDSIISQTIGLKQIEIICVDDCSTDNTLQVLMKYEEKYPDNICVIPLTENVKQGKARNIALNYASGQYVMYVDSDDDTDPGMIEELYFAAKRYDTDITACGFKFIMPDGTVQELSDICEEERLFDYNNPEDKKNALLMLSMTTAPVARLYKKIFLESNGIHFAEGVFMEDIYFTHMCLLHMKSLYYMRKYFYNYYFNSNSTMHSDKASDRYMDATQVQNEITRLILKEHKLDDCMDEVAFMHYRKAYSDQIQRMIDDRNFYSYDRFVKLKKELLEIFPEITKNPYVVKDKEKQGKTAYKLLENDMTKEQLDFIFLE